MTIRFTKLTPRRASALAIATTLARGTNSLRVAVLGSGIAGSTAARTLADRGAEVTVFEAGFGIGGRTSTRITRDEFRYQFDHGAQYIGSPKTEAFRNALDGWRSDGSAKEWTGRFRTARGLELEEDETKDRFVGYPAMHSICRNMLHHENIKVKLRSRANASPHEIEGWELAHDRTKEPLGTFDWLIVSDRNSAALHREDLTAANVEEFASKTRHIESVKSLAAMVVFEKPLGLGIDAVQFDGKDPKYGALGWAARDSSKPGRERKMDEKECWVLQSHPEAAMKILRDRTNLDEIREIAKDVLVNDFLNSIPFLIASGNEDIKIPPVVAAIGHRWSAAFPIPSEDFSQRDCQIMASKKFVACGDYFGKLPGRVEGAYLSGVSAANQLLFHEI
uniref:Amine oxidase domain-containing protein n=1 Tax=Corethron hystrix TaxID=216773 RepID=A0A7S1FPL1_9STRA|mmetsp:Transcript_18869/g.43014  ORF Transcript_18869/g.43014 Transcript_18869/m.43014 type:complete len:393 (+) Transcript_18869:175-1353(+)